MSMSSFLTPAFLRSSGMAKAGPIPMISGGTPGIQMIFYTLNGILDESGEDGELKLLSN